MSEYSHSTVQTIASALINARGLEWGVKARVELRVNVRSDRYRVPDIVVLDRAAPREEVIPCPPLVCLEVLSPEDRMSEMEERIDDYLQMGVRCVWLVDPVRRRAFLHTLRTAFEVTGKLHAPGTPIEISLDALFAEL